MISKIMCYFFLVKIFIHLYFTIEKKSIYPILYLITEIFKGNGNYDNYCINKKEW